MVCTAITRRIAVTKSTTSRFRAESSISLWTTASPRRRRGGRWRGRLIGLQHGLQAALGVEEEVRAARHGLPLAEPREDLGHARGVVARRHLARRERVVRPRDEDDLPRP